MALGDFSNTSTRLVHRLFLFIVDCAEEGFANYAPVDNYVSKY
jgi:hypothetical protein